MEPGNLLLLNTYCSLKSQNGGLFISRGSAVHPTRVIGSHELIFVKQGELDMWEENQQFHLEAGDVLHLWPGRRHGGSKPMPLGLKFYWIHFEAEAQAGKDWSQSEQSPLMIKLPQVKRLHHPERLERLFRLFLDDQETGMLHPYSANMLMMMMLIEVVQSHEDGPESIAEANALASSAHAYIRVNYDRPLTTSLVADVLGYNPDYLGRIYRKLYGCTLTESIHRRRIHFACQYLLDSNMTIEQIAQACGYTDPDYFRRVFRRYMQIAPGQYREENSHVHINTH